MTIPVPIKLRDKLAELARIDGRPMAQFIRRYFERIAAQGATPEISAPAVSGAEMSVEDVIAEEVARRTQLSIPSRTPKTERQSKGTGRV